VHRRRLICLGERAFLLWGRCSCEVWDGARLSGTFADGGRETETESSDCAVLFLSTRPSSRSGEIEWSVLYICS